MQWCYGEIKSVLIFWLKCKIEFSQFASANFLDKCATFSLLCTSRTHLETCQHLRSHRKLYFISRTQRTILKVSTIPYRSWLSSKFLIRNLWICLPPPSSLIFSLSTTWKVWLRLRYLPWWRGWRLVRREREGERGPPPEPGSEEAGWSLIADISFNNDHISDKICLCLARISLGGCCHTTSQRPTPHWVQLI